MKLFSLNLLPVMLFVLQGCTSSQVNDAAAQIALEAITNTDISYSATQCPQVKNNCGANGDYVEWTQEDGSVACACNN